MISVKPLNIVNIDAGTTPVGDLTISWIPITGVVNLVVGPPDETSAEITYDTDTGFKVKVLVADGPNCISEEYFECVPTFNCTGMSASLKREAGETFVEINVGSVPITGGTFGLPLSGSAPPFPWASNSVQLVSYGQQLAGFYQVNISLEYPGGTITISGASGLPGDTLLTIEGCQ